jgi:hypothetical protein
MGDLNVIYEEFKVQGKDLVKKIKELIHEGNIRRIIIKNENGQTFFEIPLTFAAIGVVAAPILAAIGAIAAVVNDFEIVIEKREESSKQEKPNPDQPAASQPS